MYDVIIVGGGPAGLSAALMLGRCRRRVLVVDHGKPRNAPAHNMHGYLTRDGINPIQFLRTGRDELKLYGVEFRNAEVVEAKRRARHFDLQLHDGAIFRARKVLLATGVRDQLPRLEGLAEFYGISVHHCPYCDGWEWRDRALAAYGDGKAALGLALSLRTWTSDVIVCTDGKTRSLRPFRGALRRHRIKHFPQRIQRLEGKNGRLGRIVFSDGTSVARDALFFNTGQRQKSALAEKLGCEFDRKGGVKVDHRERTCVPGLFLAGDATRDVQFVVCAAAEGAIAATAINKEFQQEEGLVL